MGEMVGFRQPDFDPLLEDLWELWPPGSYGKSIRPGLAGGWWICDPNGQPGRLSDQHTVDEHGDGTISVAPSIHDTRPGGFHGFLTRGVWAW